MRLFAKVNLPDSETKRLMIYDSDSEVYLFGYKTKEDSHANWDKCFANIADAKESSEEKYQVTLMD